MLLGDYLADSAHLVKPFITCLGWEKAQVIMHLLISTKELYRRTVKEYFYIYKVFFFLPGLSSSLPLLYRPSGWGLSVKTTWTEEVLIWVLQRLPYTPGGGLKIDTVIASFALSLTTPSSVDSTDSLSVSSLTWEYIRIINYTDIFPLSSFVCGKIIWGVKHPESREGTVCAAPMI